MTENLGRHTGYIQLMLNAANQAINYIDGMTKDDFLADPKTQDAVIMKLLVIGELASQMLEEHAEIASVYPRIPWSQMKGMRNRMAHGYFERDLDVIWETVQTSVPELASNLKQIS